MVGYKEKATLHNLQYSRDFSLCCQLIWICLCPLWQGLGLIGEEKGEDKYIWEC